MNSESRPCRRIDVLAEFLPDGSAVLYDPGTDVAYPLTASAAVVWDACDGAHTSVAMADELATVFDAAADVIDRDVRALLAQLSELGLLDRSPGIAQ